jgi:hypothetical protein
MTVPRASQRPRESWVATYQSCCTTASKSQHIKTQKSCAGKGCWPHPRVRNLSRGGPGATVGTLRTGYPRVQASSQDNGSRLPAEGSSEASMCPRGSGSRSWLGAAPRPPRAPAARRSTEAVTCHVGFSTHLLAQGNSGAATCHLGSVGCKQINKYLLATRSS